MCWYSGCEYVRTPESEKSHCRPLGWVRSVPGVKDSAHLRVRKAIVGRSAGCALFLCGGEDYVDMSEFAHVRARDFNLLTDNDTSPSPDTFERLMSAVCPEELRRCLSEHGRSFLSSLGEKQVAIDGKKLRGASPRTTGTRGDYILSAYVTENHLLVGQESVTDEENEIPAILRLLDRLDIDGAVVSIDATGTRTAIAERILEGNAHYFLAVKDNQPSLWEAVRYAFRCGSVTDTSSETEAGHGRVEERVCRIAPADSMEDEAVLSRWPGVRTVVEVTSTVTTPEGAASSVRHYISDEDHPHAAYYAMLARGHWGHREPASLASGRDLQGGRLPRRKRLRGTEPLHRQEAGAPDRQGAQRQQKHTEKVVQGITLTGLSSGTA